MRAMALAMIVVLCTAVVACSSSDSRSEGEGAGSQGSPATSVVDADTVPPRTAEEVASLTGFESPTAVVMPPPSDGAATVAWLAGEGARAARLVDASEGVWDQAACVGVGEQLEGVGTPAEVLDATAGVPDPVTAEVLDGLRVAVTEALIACGRGDVEPAAPDVAWQWLLARERLAELGL